MGFRFAVLGLVASLAGCGSGGGDQTTLRPAGSATGPGITVEHALAADTTELLLVRGSLLIRDGEARLCSGFRESHPPQCVEPSLMVHGLKEEPLKGPMPNRGDDGHGTQWADDVKLLGVVTDGALSVSETSLATGG